MEQKNKTSGWIIAIIIVLLIILGINYFSQNKNNQANNKITIDPSGWPTYTSDQYNFSISYPPSWKIATGTLVVDPAITIYKPNTTTSTAPFNHFADATHVSIYPQGIATEGVRGLTTTSTLSLPYNTVQSVDYLLDNGSVWARYINIDSSNQPDWKSYGFIWSRLKIKNLEIYCFNESRQSKVEIENEIDCSDEVPPIEAVVLKRAGQVDQTDAAIEKEILKSFQWKASQAPVTVTTPTSNQNISSPLTISGQAKGTWYFEASFPIELQDSQGNTIAQTTAQAQSDWMTEDFVPFKATLTFTAPPSGTNGTLILKKDNPSGLPQNNDQINIPVKF